jgi:hypothetical protein
MRITFESTVFDPVGSLGLEALPGSDLSAATRRVTRTATLDGQAVIIDNGYTSADSTLAIEAWLTEADIQRLQHLIQVYPEIIASTPDGCYLGVIDSVRQGGDGRTRISYLIQRTLAQISEVQPLPVASKPVDPPPPPVAAGGWFLFDKTSNQLLKYESHLLTSLDLPPNVYPSAAYSNLPVPIAMDVYGNVVIGSWGSDSSAILSTDKGATWNLLKWVEGAELETPSCLLAIPGGFLANNAFRRNYSWSPTGQSPWTYFSMPFNSSWGNISRFAGFKDAVYASFNYGSVGSLAILRSTDPGNNQWEIADPGTLSIGWSDNYEPFLLDLRDRLLCLSCQGLYRTSSDGLTWSEGFTTAIKTEGAYLRDAITGNGWVVAIDTSNQPRLYAARTTDLVFSVYVLPVETQPRALAFGADRFGLVGTGGTVITFATPGDWTVESWGLSTEAEVTGIAYFDFNP